MNTQKPVTGSQQTNTYMPFFVNETGKENFSGKSQEN